LEAPRAYNCKQILGLCHCPIEISSATLDVLVVQFPVVNFETTLIDSPSKEHSPATGLKEWAKGWDSTPIFGALKIPMAHSCYATMWADLAVLTFLIAHNFHAVVWALDCSGIWAIYSHPLPLPFLPNHILLSSCQTCTTLEVG
jgi:hypothetical protein